jgi:Ca2+-transporting ATPase
MVYSSANCFSRPASEVISQLASDSINGLFSAEVIERRKKYGLNLLHEPDEKGVISILLSQFNNLIGYLLLTAAVISFFFNDVTNGFAILVVILINAAIGFGMEYQAVSSMAALKKLDKVFVKVRRDGQLAEILSEEIVPGDILFLEAGDLVPADARLFSVSQMEVNESSLTGESVPVIKITDALPERSILAERKNMVYKGTAVTKGNGKAIVAATGMNTEFGKIAAMVNKAEKEEIPLNIKLHAFSKKLIVFTLLIVLLIAIIGLIKGRELFLMIETAISLAVAAIPEGLPIVATIALARGMLRLAKHNVIVKKLSAVETLGSTNVIFTDKTGTLTQNRLEVNTICIPGKKIEIKWDEVNKSVSYHPLSLNEQEYENLLKLLNVAALCNNASFTDSEISVGDPLEIALLKLGEYHKTGFLEETYKNFPRIFEQPFDSETKIMGTIHESEEKKLVAVKGAAEEVIKCSSFIREGEEVKAFSEDEKKKWLQLTNELAGKGLRVLAFGYKDQIVSLENFINELTFAGLAGFLDLPREEVPQALQECKEAGIRVVMVTGDHTETARNIAFKIGLTDDPDEKVIHGKDIKPLALLSENERSEILDTKIFSRVSPLQKLDLISLYQERNWITGMTGDGVNDAPALKKAEIGIAMGRRGTQVAREAADMVLQDDSFASIAKAIRYGRVVFENIRLSIVYLLSHNLSEILVVGIAGSISLTLPLQPLQILFLNMVTDVFPALAIGMNKGTPFVMKHKPRNPGEPLLLRKEWISIFVYSGSITASVLSVFFYCCYYRGFSPEISNNVAFLSLAIAQLVHLLNLSTAKESFFRNEITRNPYIWLAVGLCISILMLVYFVPPLNSILSIQALSFESWMLIFIGSSLQVLIIQLLKRTGCIE